MMQNTRPGRNTLCTCGSGKKLKRCCGETPRIHSSPPSDELNQALVLLHQGQWLNAEKLLARLIKIQPRNPTPHYLTGYAALQCGRHDEAAVAIKQSPKGFEATDLIA